MSAEAAAAAEQEAPLPPDVIEKKEQGNTFFRDDDFLKAAAAYTKAIKAAGPDASTLKALAPVYSNRSAAFVKLSKVSVLCVCAPLYPPTHMRVIQFRSIAARGCRGAGWYLKPTA